MQPTQQNHEVHPAIQTMFARRSVRKFTQQAVSKQTLELLLQAAMAAPSAMNRRSWHFIAVDEEGPLSRLRRATPLGSYKAPAAIVVCGDHRRFAPPPARDFWVQDASAAMMNVLNAATALGLGSVWIGVHPVPPLVWSVRRALYIPKNITPMGIALLGYPEGAVPTPRTQYDADKIIWQGYPKGKNAPQEDDPSPDFQHGDADRA